MRQYPFSCPAIIRYTVAVVSVTVATLLGFAVEPFNGPAAFLLYFAAVSVSSWYGRMGPTMLAVALSVVALDFFFLPPIFSLGVGLTDAVGLLVFILLAVIVNSLHWRQHRLEIIIAKTQQEFQSARRIQQKLFPTVLPALPAFDIAAACHPAKATGGDYFDFIPMMNDHLGVAIGDVSGHGFGPALLMAETHAFLRALALVHTDVGKILTLANRLVCEDTEDDHFVTLFLGCIDSRTRSFVYASAGHEGYLLDCAGKVTKLESTGLPLGVDSTETVHTSSPMILDGDQFVLLFTDGIFEAKSPDGSLFGVSRAIDLVRANRDRTAREIINLLCKEVRAFTNAAPQQDDLTTVVVKTVAAA